MTRPLNDDGTVPKKRYLRLALQVMEGREVLSEVHRELRPKWAPVKAALLEHDSSSDPPTSIEEQVEPAARALAFSAQDVVLEMTREMLLTLSVKAGK